MAFFCRPLFNQNSLLLCSDQVLDSLKNDDQILIEGAEIVPLFVEKSTKPDEPIYRKNKLLCGTSEEMLLLQDKMSPLPKTSNQASLMHYLAKVPLFACDTSVSLGFPNEFHQCFLPQNWDLDYERSEVLKVPVVIHISKEVTMPHSQVYQQIQSLNEYFEKGGIEFELKDLVFTDFVSDDLHYDSAEGAMTDEERQAFFKPFDEMHRDGVINIFVIAADRGKDIDFSGIATFFRNRFLIQESAAESTWAHEMGHVLGLSHTHYQTTVENILKDQKDCHYHGDYICDTPPDYNPTDKSFAACEEDTWTCDEVYDCAPLGAGEEGVSFDLTNVMSYHNDYCAQKFTADQFEVMRCFLHSYSDLDLAGLKDEEQYDLYTYQEIFVNCDENEYAPNVSSLAEAVQKLANKGSIKICPGEYDLDPIVIKEKVIRIENLDPKQGKVILRVKEGGKDLFILRNTILTLDNLELDGRQNVEDEDPDFPSSMHAIDAIGGKLVLNSVQIHHFLSFNAPALEITGAQLEIYESSFFKNRASVNSVMTLSFMDKVTIKNSLIYDNRAETFGAIDLGDVESFALFENVFFVNNQGGEGAAMIISNQNASQVLIKNSLFVANTGTSASSIVLYRGLVTMIGGTISGNQSDLNDVIIASSAFVIGERDRPPVLDGVLTFIKVDWDYYDSPESPLDFSFDQYYQYNSLSADESYLCSGPLLACEKL